MPVADRQRLWLLHPVSKDIEVSKKGFSHGRVIITAVEIHEVDPLNTSILASLVIALDYEQRVIVNYFKGIDTDGRFDARRIIDALRVCKIVGKGTKSFRLNIHSRNIGAVRVGCSLR